jgi:hypothetical protein
MLQRGTRRVRGVLARWARHAGDPLGRTTAEAARRKLDAPGPVPDITVEVDAAGGRGPGLVVLIPSLELRRLTGGPNTALNLGARVAARGIPVRFVASHGPVAAAEDLIAHLRDVSGNLGHPGHVEFESIAASRALALGRNDVVMATWWPTAYIANQAIRATGAPDFLYLIQDFEPAFYPWSTNFALAQQTYSMPVRGIFNTNLLRDHFVEGAVGRFAGAAAQGSVAFQPAVDRAVFRPRACEGPHRLLFYARPSKPRNAFELGLAALRRAVADGAFAGPWEFWSIGDQVPALALGGGATLEPMPWKSVPEYGELLGGSDVLLSLMLSPHPSYPPLEMATAGGNVVTNIFGVKTAAALRRFSPAITAVSPEIDALAGALASAARTPRLTESPPTALPETWDAALAPVVDWIVESMPGWS